MVCCFGRESFNVGDDHHTDTAQDLLLQPRHSGHPSSKCFLLSFSCFTSLFKDLLYMNDGLLNMVAHCTSSTNRIVSLAGGKNLAMFRVETLCIFGNVGGCIEMVVGDRGIAQF